MKGQWDHTDTYFLYVDSTLLSISEILYFLDSEIEFICGIKYKTFPFHTDTCKLRITSFSEYNTSVVYKIGRCYYLIENENLSSMIPLNFLATGAADPGIIIGMEWLTYSRV